LGRQLLELRSEYPRHTSLYRGEIERDLDEVAPYLFMCKGDAGFNGWLSTSGWGKSNGILLLSEEPLYELQKHFRRFLMVNDEAGRKLYFRFYDPRVLRVFLPTCTSQQLRELFGPVESFLIEDENPRIARLCYLRDGKLVEELIDLDAQDRKELNFVQRKRSPAGEERTIV